MSHKVKQELQVLNQVLVNLYKLERVIKKTPDNNVVLFVYDK